MNTLSPTRTLALVLALSSAPFAVTEAGYETVTLPANSATLIGQRLFTSPVVTGSLENISGTSLFDFDIDFDTALLDPPAKYLIELESGLSEGKVLEIVSFAMNTLIVDESLPSETGVFSYTIRPVRKLSDVINPMAPLATDDFNPDSADLILLPKDGGQFDQYYVSSYTSATHPTTYLNVYINVATGLPEDPYLHYPDGILFLRRDSSELLIVIPGDLKTKKTLLPLAANHNYFSSIYPVAATLETSDLSLSINSGTADTADLVWIQDGSGVFQKYFYSDGTPPLTTGWRLAGGAPGTEDDDQQLISLSVGFAIRRRAPAPYEALMSPPDFYDNL